MAETVSPAEWRFIQDVVQTLEMISDLSQTSFESFRSLYNSTEMVGHSLLGKGREPGWKVKIFVRSDSPSDFKVKLMTEAKRMLEAGEVN